MPTVAKAKPKPVDFVNNAMDLRCAVLGSLGFTTAAIMDRCGYTTSQVTYRLKKATVKRMDYRSGESEMAKFVLSQATVKAANAIRDWASQNGHAKKK